MSTRPKISLIVAALQPSMGIGAKGSLPWRLKNEMKYFKDVTSKAKDGHINAVVMGRKTWELIPERFRPLAGRLNVILSRKNDDLIDSNGVYHFRSFDSVMKHFEKDSFRFKDMPLDKIFIIGGSQIYNLLILDSRVDNLLVTQVHFVGEDADKPQMDTFLDWDLSKWKRLEHDKLEQYVGLDVPRGLNEEGSYNYEYTMWEKAQ